MELWDRYRQDIERPGFQADPVQERALHRLQQVYDELALHPRQRSRTWLARWLGNAAPANWTPVRGVYLWGGVGRGKTYLMDLLFDCLPGAHNTRVHFHRFMQSVHAELKKRRHQQDPLAHIATTWAAQTRVLCLDEFFVADIGDAMILGGLLQGLFERGLTLVATSNTHPDALYRDGLQRDRFVPAIELIKRYTAVVAVDGEVDYRLRFLDSAEIYHHPLDAEAEKNLLACLVQVAPGRRRADTPIEVLGRSIPTRYLADGVVWFDFQTLCAGPRSTADYIELAKVFHTVFVSDLRCMNNDLDDVARRFIDLVDEFYDRNVNLIVSAEAPPEHLYTGDRLRQAFSRTVSRLTEMQSHEYLARQHRP